MSSVKPVKVAVIGSGNISYTYMNTLTTQFYITDLVGCSDLIPEKSKARAELFGIRQMTNDEILSDPEIEIVLNLTRIFEHTEVTKMILNAGKSVYSEKVMGCGFAEAKANLELANSKGVRLGAAPDIYLGAAYQTARKLIEDGYIGTPISAQAICIRGNKSFEAAAAMNRPAFGQQGTTMPYDMGGYYINALVALLGPVHRVSGFAKRFTGDQGIYVNPRHPNYKEKIVPAAGASTVMGCLEFHNGAFANLVICADGFGPEIPRVEIFGTLGTLVLPDPNCFGGFGKDIYLTRHGNEGAFRMPFTHAYADSDPAMPNKTGRAYEACHNSNRGIAVADMAYAIRRNRPHRSSGELALHAVEILDAINSCNEDSNVVTLTTKPAQPAPLAAGYYGNAAEASLDM